MTRELSALVTGSDEFIEREYDRSRTVHLWISENIAPGEYLVRLWGSAFPEQGAGGYLGRIKMNSFEADALIEDLRSEWKSLVLDHREVQEPDRTSVFPFSHQWDQSRRPELLQGLAYKLVDIGFVTYRTLFRGEDKGLQRLRAALDRALRCGQQVISVESESLIVPWGMLYTPPDVRHDPPTEDHWSYEGFWGYRHLIEHTFSHVAGFDSRIAVPAAGLTVGLCADPRIDIDFTRASFGVSKGVYVDLISELFRAHGATVVIRTRKSELERAFHDAMLSDQIVFFCCHGLAAGPAGPTSKPYFELDHNERIRGRDVETWLETGSLATRPFVFFGACNGGRLASTFYSTVGRALLRDGGARCLIGPQLDLPPVLAVSYARLLFAEFLVSETKLGDIVWRLSCELINKYNNPLGLMFSLYRGIDIHLWRTNGQ
ncbi:MULTISPECIES: hypothetical protein [unclassified Nocardia]|uniref:hypothetical protein n=1 Tax=unclassified Nocardia TaxID=2637762 RepID=UPI001CE414C0|nr:MULTISPECIES: hypothetical protein [unclassified Nocardia]